MITLVTGATGLVGNNLVRRLLETGDSVRVLARKNADFRTLAGLEVQIVHGDVRDRESVFQAVRGASRVVHAAAHVRIGWTGMELARAINVEGTRNVVDAAAAEQIKLVHVSSLDALGVGTAARPADEETPPVGGILCPYTITKREAEQVILAAVAKGLNASIVNPGYMIGPYDWKPSSGRLLLQVACGWGLFCPLGSNSYCDVRDVVTGILAAAEKGQPGRRYILAGETLSYFRAWRIFAEVTGGTPPFWPAGPLQRVGAGFVGDMITKITGHETDVNSAVTGLAAQKRYFSSARAMAELGYQTRPLRESTTDAWAWFRQNGYV